MKKIVMAGASSAMARELARILHSEGHYVIGISRQEDQGYCDEWHRVQAYSDADLPNITEGLDGLVYFPGSILLKPFARYTEVEILKDFEVNVLGAINVVRKYIQSLKQTTGSGIVMISSVAAQTGLPFHLSISMSKGAIEGMVRSLAAELAPSVRVNAIAPSLTNTPLSHKLINTEEKMALSSKRHPLQSVGTVTQQAAAIKYLLLEATWTTGHIMPVDGGMKTIKLQ